MKAEAMKDNRMTDYLKEVLENMPADWLNLTTHRLDIYQEGRAKVQFLEQFEALLEAGNADAKALSELPTAFDYIRLGHPLSCVLEWVIAAENNIDSDNVISFSSRTMPILAVLRKNLLDGKKTRILYTGELPESFAAETLRRVYGYQFELAKVGGAEAVTAFAGSTIFVSSPEGVHGIERPANTDFSVSLHGDLGSIIVVNGKENEEYIGAIQHVRRRESIAMTPADSLSVLGALAQVQGEVEGHGSPTENKATVLENIRTITNTETIPLLGSSGLSVQYGIMMGLVDYALEHYPGKAIKFVVPPNCYGGTNDQARRVAAANDQVEIVDLPVDGDNDMVRSVEKVLTQIADQDAIPYIIAEIPTNPRVEVPDLENLRDALSKERKTKDGTTAIDPVFILDQTFCPNVHFLGEGAILSGIRSISYASGSKFPSGGLCTAGYCVGSKRTEPLMEKIALHLELCDNEATDLQVDILAKQLPSMNQRIKAAYANTREFVTFIGKVLPEAKINFVSEELAAEGFTPSVFSLDLPTKGNTAEEREAYKRALNHKLIKLMISRIPTESKYCVSYGQLKGCYWTIPATSTQGTTKEGDKDYIARVSLSGNMDLERHKEVFQEFVAGI
jgi:cystathionine beta-lyase/cystathionine gamma-synthase